MIEKREAWSTPPVHHWSETVSVVSTGGGYLALAGNRHVRLLRLADGASFGAKLERVGQAIGIAPDASRVAIVDQAGALQLFTVGADGLAFVRAVAIEHHDHHDNAVAISANGKLVAVTMRGHLMLFDWDTGRELQRDVVDSGDGVGFTPDGRHVFCRRAGEVELFGRDGSRAKLKADAIAFALDGRMAIASEPEGLRFGAVHELAPELRWHPTNVATGSVVDALAFSPDGRLLLAAVKGGPHAVVDTASGAVANKLAIVGTSFLVDVDHLGFSADGARALVGGCAMVARYSTKGEYASFVWSVADGRYLGALHDNDGPAFETAGGFFGSLVGRPQGETVWERPDLARVVFLGGREDEHLDAASGAQLADLDARWTFFDGLRQRAALAPDADVAALVESSKGLTHLLPMVVCRARAMRAKTPTFGAAAGAEPFTADLLRGALEELAALGPEELGAAGEAAASEAARDAAEGQQIFRAAIEEEASVDKRWLRHKDYAHALQLLLAAFRLGHAEAGLAYARVAKKQPPPA